MDPRINRSGKASIITSFKREAVDPNLNVNINLDSNISGNIPSIKKEALCSIPKDPRLNKHNLNNSQYFGVNNSKFDKIEDELKITNYCLDKSSGGNATLLTKMENASNCPLSIENVSNSKTAFLENTRVTSVPFTTSSFPGQPANLSNPYANSYHQGTPISSIPFQYSNTSNYYFNQDFSIPPPTIVTPTLPSSASPNLYKNGLAHIDRNEQNNSQLPPSMPICNEVKRAIIKERRQYSSSCRRSRSRSRDRPNYSYAKRTSPANRYKTSRDRYNPRERYRSVSKERRRSRSLSPKRRYDSRSRRSRSRSKRSRSRERDVRKRPVGTERDELIQRWRRLNCKDDAELEKRLLQLSRMDDEELLMEQSNYWIRSAPATTYYERDRGEMNLMHATSKVTEICNEFYNRLIGNCKDMRARQKLSLPPRPPKQHHVGKCRHAGHDSCSSSSDDEEEIGSEESQIMEELQRKMQHPYRLHKELWYNEAAEMNDGPLCKCSIKARRSGIRHGIYAGEQQQQQTQIPLRTNDNPQQEQCHPNTNNSNKLYHYRITISPPTNFLSKTPTIITYDEHEFIFSGFSLFSHYPLPKLPVCKVIRFNIEYAIIYAEESYPENFSIKECDLFFEYLFREILELVDLDLYGSPDKCPVFHFMPRFVRELRPEGHELLPMCQVLKYLIANYKPLVPPELLPDIPNISKTSWQDFADAVKGMIVTRPGMKPSSIRLDQLDKDVDEPSAPTSEDAGQSPKVPYPEIIHFGVRPPQLSYAGNQDYQKAWREYIKHRHLIANLSKPTPEDKAKLATKEAELQRMRVKSNMKRDVTATVSSEGFYRTGLMCDIVQHAMLIPVISCHLRFHRSLNILEDRMGYVFKNRSLLQLALTHPSYRENFGTNPDHARNSLTNCGIRQPEYGDRRIHYMSTKKRGINTLMNIMSRFGSKKEEESNIYHNERLEFLGDAVVEFVSTIHLFHMFRDLEEGGLATYRAALVQNQHLAVLAKVLSLDSFLLYAHGSDLCHDLELNHALANCFEALMGALFLDGAIDVADRVFGETIFGYDEDLLEVWEKYPPHPLKDQEPDGDRRWIEKVNFLQRMALFEQSIGVEFTHIRILARAFTDRSVGYTNLTLGSNQRLEFLGDSVLQLVASEYLYKHFPDHHEGHLSLLRSSLVNNNTQSVVCDDLGMTAYARYAATKGDLKIKDKADLLEAFLGALYVDKGSLLWVEQFCKVCFFPRLQDFIMNQEWNDPKSKLQQCCLTLRTMDGGEPDIPCYKVVECKGPTNTRTYSVAVYFKNKRLATASGHSIQQAEMNAAQVAMKTCANLFPNFDNQSKILAKAKSKGVKEHEKERGNGRSKSRERNYKHRNSNNDDGKHDHRRRRSNSCGRRERDERSISSDRNYGRDAKNRRQRSRSIEKKFKRHRGSSRSHSRESKLRRGRSYSRETRFDRDRSQSSEKKLIRKRQESASGSESESSDESARRGNNCKSLTDPCKKFKVVDNVKNAKPPSPMQKGSVFAGISLEDW